MGSDYQPATIATEASNPCGMKAKINSIAQIIKMHGAEVAEDRAIIDRLKAAQANTAQVSNSALQNEIDDLKRYFAVDIAKLEEEFLIQANLQKSENSKIQQALTQLKAEKTAIHQQVLSIQRRVEELEDEVGRIVN